MKMSEIIIHDCFKRTYPSKQKMKKKKSYLRNYNKYESPIIIDEDNFLIDGYITYILSHYCEIIPKVYKRIGQRYYEIKIEFEEV